MELNMKYLCDAHLGVVDNASEIIGRDGVRAIDDEVAEVPPCDIFLQPYTLINKLDRHAVWNTKSPIASLGRRRGFLQSEQVGGISLLNWDVLQNTVILHKRRTKLWREYDL